MEKSKKIKVDMNPKKVANPTDSHKRSPGKFDQKIYMEQENFSAHAIKEMARIHAMQVHSVSTKYERDMISMRVKRKQLENKNTGYTYLKQLRQAFNDENDRRETLARRLEEFARKQAEPTPVVEEELIEEEPEKNYKPWENVQTKLPEIKKEKTTVRSKEPTFVQIHGVGKGLVSNSYGNFCQSPASLNNSLSLSQTEETISTSEKQKLEKMSRDIITATLPVERLRRILPSDNKSCEPAYPIMSYYRRHIILPEVKKCKRKLSTDTNLLHSRIDQYFGTHLPLSSYSIPRSAKPHKQKLLNAISHDDFRLPHIPPEFR